MHKAIYTVDEDLSGVTYLIFFAILWYSFLLRVTITRLVSKPESCYFMRLVF